MGLSPPQSESPPFSTPNKLALFTGICGELPCRLSPLKSLLYTPMTMGIIIGLKILSVMPISTDTVVFKIDIYIIQFCLKRLCIIFQLA